MDDRDRRCADGGEGASQNDAIAVAGMYWDGDLTLDAATNAISAVDDGAVSLTGGAHPGIENVLGAVTWRVEQGHLTDGE